MERSDTSRAARRAYELGRLRSGLWGALYAVPLVLLALVFGNGSAPTAGLGFLLYFVASGLFFRGQAYGRAVRPGLLAGAAALLVPLFAQRGHCCIGGSCVSICFIACVLGGLAGGAILGLFAIAERKERGRFLLAAGSITALTGALGCLPMGFAGLMGMSAALIASSAPLYVRAALEERGAG